MNNFTKLKITNKAKKNRISYLAALGMYLMLLISNLSYGQNAIVGSDFSTGWGVNNCTTSGGTNFKYLSLITGSAGTGTYGLTTTANGLAGNKYFRFGKDWSSTYGQYAITPGSDVAISPNTQYNLNMTCTNSGSQYINVTNTSYNYVFKTINAGTAPTGTFVMFEVQGAVQSVSSVAAAPSTNIPVNMPVTVTATTSGALSSGQAVYLRYTTNAWSTSTVVQMTGSGTTYSGTIPGLAASTAVSYYVFTSGTANVASNGSNADLYTINLNNNGASNYSYTVTSTTGNVWVTSTGGTGSSGVAYTTLNAAFTAINAGTHTGSITVTILANTTEPGTPVPLTKSGTGSSSYTSINIKPSGNRTITGTPTTNKGIIELLGADNITIDGDDPSTAGTQNLTITQGTSTASAVACIKLASNSTIGADGANNNTVKNCIIIGSRSTATDTTGSSYGIVMSDATITTGAYNSINTIIQNNIITRCSYGINAAGSSSTYPNTGLQILNNIIGTPASGTFADATTVSVRGIVLSYTATSTGAAIIRGNDIRVGVSVTGYSLTVAGIEVGTVNYGVIIDKNNIHDISQPVTGGYGAHGIYFTGATNCTLSTISNNIIRDVKMVAYQTSATSTFIPTGVFFTAGATGVNFVNNTIVMGSQLGTGNWSSFCIDASVSGVVFSKFLNNILVNSHTSTSAYGLYTSATTNISGGTVNNNNYYVPNTGYIGYYNTSSYTTLAAWQTATSKDGLSKNVNPSFISSTDLHLNTTGNSYLESAGASVATSGVSDDFDGQTRPGPSGSINGGGTAPDIGADEFDGVPLASCTVPNAPTLLTFNTVTTTTLNGSFTAPTTAPTNYIVIRSTSSSLSASPADGTSYAVNDLLGGGTVVALPTSTTFTQTSLTAGTLYYYYVYSVNSSSCIGGPKYSTTNISGSQATQCSAATSLTAGTINPTGATLTWTGSGNYIVEYGAAGFTPGTGATAGTGGTIASSIAATPYSLTGLTAGTSYDVYVRQVCPISGYSANSTKVTFTPTCSGTPTALTSSNISGTTATISWTAATPAPISGYEYYVSTVSTAPTAGTTPTGTTAGGVVTANLTGLTSSSLTYFWVRSNCDGTNKGAWSSSATFTTTQIPASLPYTQNFTSANDFSFVNGAQTNKWAYGSAAGNPANALYISNDSGVTNAYTLTAASTVQTYRDIAIPAGTTLTNFSFDWKANGESCCDYLRVWLAPTTFNPTAGTQITAGGGIIQVGGNLNVQTTWQTYSNTVLDLTSFANTTMRLIFEWRNDTSLGTSPPAAIDNISLSVPTCAVPTMNATTNIASTTATINWTAPTSAPSNGYNYEIRTSGAGGSGATGLVTSGAVGAGIVTANITGLTAATAYSVYVQSNCGGSGTSSWTTASTGAFTTACTVPNNPGTISVTAVSSTGLTLNYAAASPAPTNYILFNTTGTVSTAIPSLVTGTTYTNGTAYTFGGNSYNCITNTSASPQVLTGGISNTQYNYFLYSKSTTSSCFGNPYYSTGVTVSVITCPAAPTLPVASSVTSSSATVSWTASVVGGGAATINYTLEVYTDLGYTTPISGSPFSMGTSVSQSLTGLSASTTYYYRIKANNGSCDSAYLTGTVTTVCDVITSFPYTMAFDGSSDCWTSSTGTAPWALGASSTDITTPQSGSGFIYKPYSTSTQYLYSPPINLSSFGSNQARLNFWIYRHSATVVADQISFKINTTNSNSGATNLQTYSILSTQSPAEASSGWYNYKVDIPTSWNSAGIVYVVIEGITTAGFSSYDIGLDNFVVEAKPPSITITPSSVTICNGDSTSLTASSGAAYTYTWSPATGLSTTNGATVSANPTVTTTYTVTGVAGAMTTTQTITVTVNPAPAAVTITPSATTCPNVITTLTASSASIGTYTVGTSSGSSAAKDTPYRQGVNTQARMQYLITKAELNASGINGPANITSIAFNVTSIGGGTIPTYTISMGNSNATVMTTTFQTPTLTTVYTGTNYVVTLGVNTHTFTTPFAWDGTSNVIVNICMAGVTAGTTSTVSVSTPSVVSTTSLNGANACSAATGNNTSANRPVMTFGIAGQITWSPTTDLYTDSGASTAYTGGAANTVYTKPTATRTYTATATLGSCTKTNTTTITTKIPVGITSVTAGASPICATATTSLTANGVVGTNTTVTWYTGAGGTGTNLGTGLTLSNVGPGTYYARVTGDCGSPAEVSITVGAKVNVGITSVTAATNPICNTATTTLTANGVVGTNASVTWYTGSGATGTNLGTGTTLTAGPGTYYARVTGDCGSPVEASITVGTKVNVAITGISAVANPICASASTTLTANGVVGTGAVVTWYTGSGATGTNLGSSATLIVGPGTYYAYVTGDCGSPAEANYTINTIPSLTWANLQWPPSGSICQGGTYDAYGQVYQAGITDAAGKGDGITVEFGYSTTNSDPSTWTNWSTASYNTDSGNNDEYKYTFTPPTSGTYYYTFRYRPNTCSWQYGGYNAGGGGFWDGNSNVNGVITSNDLPSITLGYIDDVSPLSTSFTIPFSNPTGSNLHYSLVTTSPNALPSFTSVYNQVLGSSPIVVAIPASQPGEYSFVISIINGDTGCTTAYPFQFHIISLNHGVIGSNQTICSGQTPNMLTNIASATGAGTITYSWEQSTTGIDTGYTQIIGANSASYSPGPLTQTTYFKRVAFNGLETSDSDPVTISINTIGTISAVNGITTINGENSTTYSVSPVTNASCYVWSLPAGMSIASSSGNEIITNISNSFNGGIITVKASNSCGDTAISTLNINNSSTSTLTISGPKNVCSLTNATYYVNPISGASYIWTLPNGMTLNSGANTNSINVTLDSSFNIGAMSLIVTTNTNTYNYTLTIGRLDLPEVITGPTNLCGITTASYSIPSISGATSYTWTVPSGVTVVGASNSNSINVNITGNVSGSIVVQASGSCGLSPYRSLKIETTQKPSDIVGPTQICGATTYNVCNGGLNISSSANNEALYSIGSISGANSYTWSTPNGVSILSGQGTNSIKVSYDLSTFSSGQISVASVTNCGTSGTKTLDVGTNKASISGPTALCDLTTATYSVPSTAGTSFMWTLPSCMTLASGQSLTNNSITVNITGPICGTQTLSVAITGSCGPTNNSSLALSCTKNTKIQNSQNGAVVASNIPVYADAITGALGYRFRITNTDGFVSTIDKTSRYFTFSEIAGISYGKTYSIEVAIQTATSSYTDNGYGCSIPVTLNGTKIQTSQCGITIANNLPVYADTVVGAIGYKFEISDASTGTVISTLIKTNRYFYFNEITTLSFGATYNVRVAIKNPNGTYSPYGQSCGLTLQSTKVQSTICGTTVASNTAIYADSVVGATGYKFEISNALGTVIATLNKTSNFFYFNEIPSISFGANYQVRVAPKNTDNSTYGLFGASCQITLPKSQVQTAICGTIVASNTPIYADSVIGATGYKFEISNALGTVIATLNKTSNFFYFNEIPSISFGANYQVRVAVKNIDNTTYSGFGNSCQLTLQTSQIQASQCGATVFNTTNIYADIVADATGYKFEISNTSGTVIATLLKSTRYFNFTEITNATINTTYLIRVAPKNPDNSSYGSYGSSCSVTCQIQNTKIQASQCGTTIANNLPVYADLVNNASGYRFEITNSNGTVIATLDKNIRYFYFNEIQNVSYGETYTIRVAPKNPDGITYGIYGTPCTLTLQTTKIQSNICGTSIANNLPVYADNVIGATGYRFEISNSNGVVITTIDRANRYFYFNEISGLSFGTSYSIRVAPKNVNGTSFGLFGSSCQVTLQGTKIQDSQCGSSVGINLPIYADNVVGATGYRFEISNNTGSIITTLDKTSRYFYFNEISGITLGTDYYIRVAIKNVDGITYGPFGATCVVSTLKTKIQASQCGTTFATNTLVYADAIVGATGYRFEISNNSGTVIATLNKSNRYFYFNEVSGITVGSTYSIRVATKNPDNATYSPYGVSCNVTISSTSAKIEEVNHSEFYASTFPNPFENNFKLRVQTNNDTNYIHIKIYDMLGKQIEENSISPTEIELYEFGNRLSSGVYNLIISQGEETKTLRIIKR